MKFIIFLSLLITGCDVYTYKLLTKQGGSEVFVSKEECGQAIVKLRLDAICVRNV